MAPGWRGRTSPPIALPWAASSPPNATEAQLNTVIADLLAKPAAPGSDAQKIRDYYRAYLDTAAIEARACPGQARSRPFCRHHRQDRPGQVLGQQVRADLDPLNATNFHTENLFGLFVTQALTGGEVVPYLMQGGLGLPERDYYLSTDPKMVTIQGKYRAYIATLLTDAGLAQGDAQARADAIYALEMKIAQAHESREESEDFQHATTLWTRAELLPRRPGWTGTLSCPAPTSLDGRSPPIRPRRSPLAALVASEPLSVWKDWLAFHQVNQYAASCPSRSTMTASPSTAQC
jgi:predicted metalloendopeptidase